MASSSVPPTGKLSSRGTGGVLVDNSTPHHPAQVLRNATRRSKQTPQVRSGPAGGSTSTMMRLYTEDTPGLRVDPVVVMVMAVVFIISVATLHLLDKYFKIMMRARST